jgi:hypothetical protein
VAGGAMESSPLRGIKKKIFFCDFATGRCEIQVYNVSECDESGEQSSRMERPEFAG